MALTAKRFAQIPLVVSLWFFLGLLDAAMCFLDPTPDSGDDFLLNRLSVKADSLPSKNAADHIPVARELVEDSVEMSLDDQIYRGFLSMAQNSFSPTTAALLPKNEIIHDSGEKWWDLRQAKMLESLSLNNDASFRGLSKDAVVFPPCRWNHAGFTFFHDPASRRKGEKEGTRCGVDAEMATLSKAMGELSPQDAHKIFQVGGLHFFHTHIKASTSSHFYIYTQNEEDRHTSAWPCNY